MRNAKTTQELYEQLLQMPDLHSLPQLDGEVLTWKLYKNAYVRAYCDSYDTCIEIISTYLDFPSAHWHPAEEGILDELYALGKKGNILVLKHAPLAIMMGVFYVGDPNKYRFRKNKK